MKLRMQIIDADYFLNNGKPVVRLFGKTEDGQTICGMYDSFNPYFYIQTGDADDETAMRKISAIKEIRDAEWCRKFVPLGFQKDMARLLKLTLTNPQDVPKARDKLLLERTAKSAYEADVLFKYRFLIDKCIKGMQWVEMECEREQKTVKSKAPIYRIQSIAPVERNENAPLRYLAFDIECIPADAAKPIDAKRDPIVMIAISFLPAHRDRSSVVLVARPVTAEGVKGFFSEKEMLAEFLNIIDIYDPDVLTGYNINSFDLPYLVERLKQHKLPVAFGRSDKEAFGRQGATAASMEFSVNGRVVADPYQILKRDPWVKLHRYDLKTVARKLLNEEKHDVEYGEMPNLWNGGQEELSRFIEYARKDAELSMKLLAGRGMLDKFFELSKISGLLLQDTFGGQTRRIETMLMHEFRQRGFVMPGARRRGGEDSLKGATVLEPEKGLHADGCVLVLDFKSLYPSLMRTYNISPDTVLNPEQIQDVPCHQSPSGAYFVDESVYKGIFPGMLTELLEARSVVRKLMKEKTGEEKRILNARNLALKDMSNSIYGYTGYTRARLYMIDVANSVTSYGRENLEKTKKLIEENFGLKVIYADTDSAFVKTGTTNLEEATALGERIEKFVTDSLPGVLELQFEKIYKTFLILTKKRYAGWRFDYHNGEWRDEIEMRGIETVRRDWCQLVSDTMNQVLEIILKEKDVQKATAYMKDILDKLKKNQIPLEKLTVIKGITQSIESYRGTLPHIELARKMAVRAPHDKPRIGDRLGFVIVKGNMMLSKRAEDPAYVEKNKLPVDSDYYMESQLFPPIERIFSAMGIERSELLGGGHQVTLKELFASGRSRTNNNGNNGSSGSAAQTDLEGWDGFVCGKCNRSYRRMPLAGVCDCGGTMLISFHGSAGDRVVMK